MLLLLLLLIFLSCSSLQIVDVILSTTSLLSTISTKTSTFTKEIKELKSGHKTTRYKDHLNMVFSSMPAYLDPANWQQQPSPHHHLFSGINNPNNNNNSQLHSLPPPLPPLPSSNSGSGGNVGPGGAGSIRPNSMVDRARMANIPLPEPALKCPRCDSTNTKFCYFNNYNLTQPRHFCKTCRRYWTRGGALRNVPVGGGLRRNKRSSSKGGSSRSKSPDVSSSDGPAGSATSSAIPSSSAGTSVEMIAPMRFINNHPFSSTIDHHQFGGAGESLGMSYGYGGGAGGGELGFSIGGSGSVFEQQWRFQQQITPSFPFLTGGLEGSNGLFVGGGGRVDQFQGYYSHLRPRLLSSGGTSLSSSVIKTEDPHHNQVLGNETGQQYWINAGGNGNGASINAWTDISGFSSTSAATNHPL